MSLIVLIAPNKSVADVALKAKQMFNLDMDIHIGLMQEGVDIAKKLSKKDSKVFISRGGTAILIRQELNEQVVEIKMVLDDAVCAINEARKYGNRIRFIGFSNHLQGFDSLGHLMGLNIEQYVLRDWKDIKNRVLQAKEDGVDVLVGGALQISEASKIGLPSVFLDTSEASILQAYNDAKTMLNIILNKERKEKEIQTILDYSGDGFVAIDKDGYITLANDLIHKIFNCEPKAIIGTKIGVSLQPLSNLTKTLSPNNDSHGDVISINDYTILYNKIPLVKDGQIVGAMATLKDIKNVQEEDKRIRYKQYVNGLYAKYHFTDIIGNSKEMNLAKKVAKSFSKADSTVLITSETGTGKELFAQSIHNDSPRENGPFVAVNCASLAESILESELFGYVDGAFTGTRKCGKAGLFEMAKGGTLFLDEIGEIPLKLQAKLLRVLQERCVMRLGDDKIIPIDVRFIAATNRNLIDDIREGSFRSDLFFRLNVLHLTIPPLRERGNDIIELSKYFLQKYGTNSDIILTCQVKILLKEYEWPGNVRELENVIERLSVTCLEKKPLEMLEDHIREFNLNYCDKVTLDYSNVNHVLTLTNGNKTKAAKILGVHRSTLWRFLNNMEENKKNI